MAYSQAKIFQAKFMRQAEKLAPHVAESQKIDKKLLRTFFFCYLSYLKLNFNFAMIIM